MRAAVDEVLKRYGGVASRRRLLEHLPVAELDDEIRRGRLVRVFRRAYCRPWDADLTETQVRGALASVGSPVALSHVTALHRSGLLDEQPDRIHLSVPAQRVLRPQQGIAVHRVARFPTLHRVDGLVTTCVAASVIDSWPLLRGRDQRASAIAAVRTGAVTPASLAAELDRHPRLPGRRQLAELVRQLSDGCESELEIWGHASVFRGPGLEHGVRQHRLSVHGARYRLDLAFIAERVAVEMDGERWHSTREQRERDRRRDAALASAGWVTLRFSHRRLHDDPAGCRRDTLATLARRH